jgi:hypothetical protein
MLELSNELNRARRIEHLHVEEAQRLVALAEVIAVLEAEASS